jgi:hypothetical protein
MDYLQTRYAADVELAAPPVKNKTKNLKVLVNYFSFTEFLFTRGIHECSWHTRLPFENGERSGLRSAASIRWLQPTKNPSHIKSHLLLVLSKVPNV